MIIDSHTHIYPDKIAERAVVGIGTFYNVDVPNKGTVEDLLFISERAGVDKCLVCSVATKAEQVKSINDFIASAVNAHPDKFYGFGSIFPGADDMAEQVDALIERGLTGIKLHPDCQKFNCDNEDAMALYSAVNGRVPILFHAGDYRTDYSSPERLLRVSKEHPELDMILAHFGGWGIWGSHAEELAKCPNVWVDMSSSQQFTDAATIFKLIKLYGSERVFFGSDYPMWDAKDELALLRKLDLSDEELENIYHRSFEKFISKYVKK